MPFEVSEKMPPYNPGNAGAWYWERGIHPFGTATGWSAIDYAENVVGFVHDGYEYPDDMLFAYHIAINSYDRIIAIPYGDLELLEKLAKKT